MREQQSRAKRPFAEQFYSLLLHLYPPLHHQEYGPLMLQAFRDYYRETRETQGKIGIIFWLEVLADEIKSLLREHLSFIQGGIIMQWIIKQQGILFGLLLGVLAIGAIFWTNVLFPNFEPDSEYQATYTLSFLLLFLFFVFVGFMACRQSRHVLSGTWAGALTALLGFGITTLTFVIVDNVWLDIVSHQADKIYGFQHSTFHTMRDYINAGLLSGSLAGLPLSAGIGAACGTLGAALQKFINFKRSNS